MNKKLNFGTLLLVMALVVIPQGSAATLDGAAIYASKCQMCHGTLATHNMIPNGITAAQITASFAPGGKMYGKGVTLAAGEAQAIADAITPPVVDTTKPVITAPADVSVVAAVLPMIVNIGTATATDNSGIAPVITNDAPAKFGLGVTTVTWTATDGSGNFATATQKVTVTSPVQTPPVLTTITVTPATANLLVNGTQVFTASAKDQNGNAMTPVISWTSSNETVGTIDTSGNFSALEAGTTTIKAENGTVNGTASVTVTTTAQTPVLTTIKVVPPTAKIIVGKNRSFMAKMFDQFNNKISALVTWASSNTSVGTIDNDGNFTALSSGKTTITATNGTINGSATITVMAKSSWHVDDDSKEDREHTQDKEYTEDKEHTKDKEHTDDEQELEEELDED